MKQSCSNVSEKGAALVNHNGLNCRTRTLRNNSCSLPRVRLGVYCNDNEFSRLEELASVLPNFGQLSVILAGQASLDYSSSSPRLKVRPAVDIARTPVDFPNGVKYLEAKWVFVNQTDSAIIFCGPPPLPPEALSYLMSYSRKLIEGGAGGLLIVTPQPDQLSGRLMASCDELEMSRLKQLLDTRSLSIIREIDSDSLRFICGIH